jgi:hypothetical protein
MKDLIITVRFLSKMILGHFFKILFKGNNINATSISNTSDTNGIESADDSFYREVTESVISDDGKDFNYCYIK